MNFCLVYKSKTCNKNSILWRKLISRDFNIDMHEPYGDNLKEDYIKFNYFNDNCEYYQNDKDLIKYGNYAITLRVDWFSTITNSGLKHVPNLIYLKLQDFDGITDKGLKHVPKLTKLNLYGNENITDEGLKHVPNLTYLNLSWNRNITNKGLKYLSELYQLKLMGNFIIDRETLSHVKIYDD